MKIYRVEYTVQGKVDGEKEWNNIGNQHIDVAAPSVKRALRAAELYALTPSRFFDSDTKKMATERFRKFEALSVNLLAEADIKG
jgi:hypothetical protein